MKTITSNLISKCPNAKADLATTLGKPPKIIFSDEEIKPIRLNSRNSYEVKMISDN